MFYHSKTWAENEMELFLKLCKEKYGYDIQDGGIFLDIGANIGTTSIWMDIKSQGCLEIHAIEPVPSTYRILKANCAINGDRIITHNIAISNSQQELDMLIFPNNKGRNQVLSSINSAMFAVDSIKVNSIRLDDFLQTEHINFEKIKYIWIDVEGHEPAVIDGMSKLLTHRKIPVFMEFSYDAMNIEMVTCMQDILVRTYDKAVVISTKDENMIEINVSGLVDYYREVEEQKNIFLY